MTVTSDAPFRERAYRDTLLGPPIGEWLSYKRLQDRSELTIDAYERRLSQFALRVPLKAITEITTRDALDYLGAVPKGSRRLARAAMTGFFDWALDFEYVDVNPMRRVPIPARPQKDVYNLFDEVERNQLEHLPALRDSALMALPFGAAIRNGEARKAQVSHLRREGERHVLFVDRKGRKKRLVPLRPRVVGILEQLIVQDGLECDDYLWYTTRGRYRTVMRDKPLGYPSFQRWWCRCLVEAGIVPEPNIPRSPDWLKWEKAVRAHPDYRNPHITRHTYATEYLRRGGAIEKLSRILGHSSVAVTDAAYAHLVTGTSRPTLPESGDESTINPGWFRPTTPYGHLHDGNPCYLREVFAASRPYAASSNRSCRISDETPSATAVAA